jgi:hypothetical protein
MATFPKLKTKAVAQYPASKLVVFQNQVLRFVDGSEQRYRDSAGPLHRWVIRLKELDEGEMSAVESFFSANRGRFASFTFRDPWDGTEYPNCSVQVDELELVWVGEMRGRSFLAVVENRG